MFRLTLISLFLVAANADLFGTNELARQLQDFDLDAFQFNFAGVNINAELAQAACPAQWQATVSCVISDCPTFMDVCPDLEVPAENQGTAAPMESPVDPAVTDETMDMPTMDEVVGNVTHMLNETMGEIMDGDMEMPDVETLPEGTPDIPSIPAEEVPSCEEIEEEFCTTLSGEDISDCCLLDCVEQLQSLVSCVVMETTGVDRSDCRIPECPEPEAPVVTATDTTTAPASSATGVVSRIAVFVAVAFAML